MYTKTPPAPFVPDLTFMKEGFTPEQLLEKMERDCRKIAENLHGNEKIKMQKYADGFAELKKGYGGLGIMAMGSLLGSIGSYSGAVNALRDKFSVFEKEFKGVPENMSCSDIEVIAAFIKKEKQVVQEFKDAMPDIAKGAWLIHDVYPILMGQFALAPMTSNADMQFQELYAVYILDLQANWGNLKKGTLLGMAIGKIPVNEPYKDIDAQIKGKLANVAGELFQNVAMYNSAVDKKKAEKALNASVVKTEEYSLNQESVHKLDEALESLKSKADELMDDVDVCARAIDKNNKELEALKEAEMTLVKEELGKHLELLGDKVSVLQSKIEDCVEKIVVNKLEQEELRVKAEAMALEKAELEKMNLQKPAPSEPQSWLAWGASWVVAPVNAVVQVGSAVTQFMAGPTEEERLKQIDEALITAGDEMAEEKKKVEYDLESLTAFYETLKKPESNLSDWAKNVKAAYDKLDNEDFKRDNPEAFAAGSTTYQLFVKHNVKSEVSKEVSSEPQGGIMGVATAIVYAPVNAVYAIGNVASQYMYGSPKEVKLQQEPEALELEQVGKVKDKQEADKELQNFTDFYDTLKKPDSNSIEWIKKVKLAYERLDNDQVFKIDNPEVYNAISGAYQLFVKEIADNKIKEFEALKVLDVASLEPENKEEPLFEHLANIIKAEKELKLFQEELMKINEVPIALRESIKFLKSVKDETVKQLAELAGAKLTTPDIDSLNEAKATRGILGGVYVQPIVVKEVKDVFGKLKQSYEKGEAKPECLEVLSDQIKHAEVEFGLKKLKDPGIAKLYREVGGANFLQARYRKNDIAFLQKLFDKINLEKDDTRRLELMLGAIKAVKEEMKVSRISIGVGRLNLMLDDIGHTVEHQLKLRPQRDAVTGHFTPVVINEDKLKKLKGDFKDYLIEHEKDFSKFHLNAKIKSHSPHHWYDNFLHVKLHMQSFHMPHMFDRHVEKAVAKDAAKKEDLAAQVGALTEELKDTNEKPKPKLQDP